MSYLSDLSIPIFNQTIIYMLNKILTNLSIKPKLNFLFPQYLLNSSILIFNYHGLDKS